MSYGYIDETGLHLADYDTIYRDLQEQFRGIYGQDVYLEPDSQDGAHLAIFALAIHNAYQFGGSVYNAFSPQTAQGAGLSRMVKINGIRRHSSSYSQAPVRIVGQAGTIIDNGIVKDSAGKQWALPELVSIPSGGEIFSVATALEVGEIRAAAGEISEIATPKRGWQTVTNITAAVVGNPVETDYTLRRRQSRSTALPSQALLDGITGAVENIKDVTRVRDYENDTDQTDGHGIPAHHCCYIVEGGDPQAIADAINIKKTPGAGTYGDVFSLVYDKHGVPKYIWFFRPARVDFAAVVYVRPLSGYLSSTGETIRTNLAEYANTRRIGESVLLSKLSKPIEAAEPKKDNSTFDVLAVRIGRKGSVLTAANLPVIFKEAITADIEDILVIPVEKGDAPPEQDPETDPEEENGDG